MPHPHFPNDPNIAELRDDGWLKVNLDHLRFPNYCCVTGQFTRETRLYSAATRLEPLLRLLGAGYYLNVDVPTHPEGNTHIKKTKYRAAIKGLLIGIVVVGAGFGLLPLLINYDQNLSDLAVAIACGAFVVGMLILPGIFYLLAERKVMPVKFRRYDPVKRTVQMKFEYPEYTYDVFSNTINQKDGWEIRGLDTYVSFELNNELQDKDKKQVVVDYYDNPYDIDFHVIHLGQPLVLEGLGLEYEGQKGDLYVRFF